MKCCYFVFLCVCVCRWLKEAQDSSSTAVDSSSDGKKRGILYTASPASSYAGPMKIINNIFNSDLVFNLRREDESLLNSENGEVGISGRDYALVPGEMWLQAFKWSVFSIQQFGRSVFILE